MSVLTFAAPVSGRKLDVLAFQTDTPFSMTTVKQHLFDGNGGKATGGLQKLAQQVLIRLFTSQGNKRFEPEEGTTFATDIMAGRIRTAVDASRSLADAKEQLFEQFRMDVVQDSTIPLDERLADLQIVSVKLVSDTLYLTLKVISVAVPAASSCPRSRSNSMTLDLTAVDIDNLDATPSTLDCCDWRAPQKAWELGSKSVPAPSTTLSCDHIASCGKASAIEWTSSEQPEPNACFVERSDRKLRT